MSKVKKVKDEVGSFINLKKTVCGNQCDKGMLQLQIFFHSFIDNALDGKTRNIYVSQKWLPQWGNVGIGREFQDKILQIFSKKILKVAKSALILALKLHIHLREPFSCKKIRVMLRTNYSKK